MLFSLKLQARELQGNDRIFVFVQIYVEIEGLHEVGFDFPFAIQFFGNNGIFRSHLSFIAPVLPIRKFNDMLPRQTEARQAKQGKNAKK
ncbi:MAG: hypothetical protein IPM82_07460 [Saprospiraceae bacterium]|nr:hypothetical protein [Saprospiraceae bacterium]